MSDRRQLLQESLSAIARLEARLAASERAMREPLAIVGAGCRYPGGVTGPDALWDLLDAGIDAVAEVPADRWDADAYYDPNPKAAGKMVTKRGGFLSDIDRFDAPFFSISPREAATLDPQQRLLLETAYEALERAGIAPDRLAGSSTGVFVGITTGDYGQLIREGGSAFSDVYSATGSALNAAAGRIAFTLGLQGPCVALDTACSSSLVAIHLACQSLRARECDLALASGVNVILSPDAMVLFSKWGMMAPDGACKTFDAAADGFVRSEGCATIVLKRLADAQAAGDPILAVIRGSAVNSDGRSSGLTVPNGPAQQAVLRRALANADLTAADIDYVEAHGTGTSLGDPIEVEALAAILAAGHSADRPLIIGSVKTNLGHTEAASGLAGLLKTVMALRHERIPPHLHFSRPNPAIPWSELPLLVPRTAVAWPRTDRPRRAGVSSFGFSGTNAHVILEEAPLAAPSLERPPYVVPLSARDDRALRDLARRTADYLNVHLQLSLVDVAETEGCGRAHFPRRLATIVESTGELATRLGAFGAGQPVAEVLDGASRMGERPRIAFLFTGQGSQYPGMGRELYDSEPMFRAVIDRAARSVEGVLDRPLFDVLFPASGAAVVINDTAYTQPALFVFEYALAELWRSWGVVPSVVGGHSLGEYVAACVAGVFSFEDGLALVAERGRLMQALPAGGGMAAVFADEARLLPYLDKMAGRLSVAGVNGPEETVVSGDATLVGELVSTLQAAGIQSRTLEVSHALHSALLDPMLDALERTVGAVRSSAPVMPLLSNLTGRLFLPGETPDARYWRRHARETVRFAANLEALKTAGATVLLEIGPHPTLTALARRAMPDAKWTAVSSMRRGRGARRELLSALATLYVHGASINWDALNRRESPRRVELPTYPFQRERHWLTAHAATATPRHHGHPLLGERRDLATAPGTSTWEGEIAFDLQPWLRDHRVQDAAIVPATAYIEMALAAGTEVLGGALVIRELENVKPIILNEGDRCRVQTTLVVAATNARFTIHSRVAGGPWTLRARGELGSAAAVAADGLAIVEQAKARCPELVQGVDFYAALAREGNQWGPTFQGLQRVWRGEGEAVAEIQAPPTVAVDQASYCFHPALSDACGHALVALMQLARESGSGAFVGGGVGETRFYQRPGGGPLWAHARLHPKTGDESRVVMGDVRVYDESGALISETLGARLWFFDEAEHRNADQYRVRWHEQALADGSSRTITGPWMVFADRNGVGRRIVERRRAAGERTVMAVPGERADISGDAATVRPRSPEDFRAALDAAGRPGVIVYLWDGEDAPAETVLHLLQAVLASGDRVRPRVWLVTSDAQAVVAADRCDSPRGAILWGLGRTLSAEHAELWGGLIDIDRAASADDAATAIVQEIGRISPDDKIAFRRSRRYVPRLERRPRDHAAAARPLVRSGATYAITGGLGGIALAMARWLVEHGARHILLIGRTPLPDRALWPGLDASSAAGRRIAIVQSLETQGAEVEIAAADVAAPGAISALLERRRASALPPVHGVIHAAGVLHFSPLATEAADGLNLALAAKVDGAWELHRAVAAEPIDWFVLCSSSSAILTSPLLGAYAGGNAFLDALAHHRRGRGLPALSINWGTWGEVGMAAASDGAAPASLMAGVGTISTAAGLETLGELMRADEVQAAVMPVNWRELARAYPGFAADPFFSSVIAHQESDSAGAAVGRMNAEANRAALATAGAEKRSDIVRDYLRREAAKVLGMSANQLDPAVALSSLGFDSLMAVQLKNGLESDFGVVVPMITFLQGTSVDELTPAIAAAAEVMLSEVLVEEHAATAGRTAGTVAIDWEEGTL